MNKTLFILFGSFCNLIIIGVYKSIIGSTMPSFLDTFQVTPSQAGLLFTFNFIGNFLAVIFGSFAADNFGKKPLLLIGNLLLGSGAGLFFWLSSFVGALIGMFFIGAGAGIVANLSRAVLTDLNFQRIGSLLNFSGIFVTIGGLLTPLVVRWLLIGERDWKIAYFLMMIGTLICFAVYLSTKFPQPRKTDGKINLGKIKELLSDRTIRLLALAMALYLGGEVSLFGWSDVFLQRIHLIPEEDSKLYLSFFWVMMIVGRLLYSFVLRYRTSGIILKFISISAFISIIGMSLVNQLWLLLFFYFFSGLALSGFYNTILSYATEHFNQYISSIFGIILGGGAIGVIFIPWVIGILEGVFGLRFAYLMNCIPYGLLILVFFFFLKDRSGAEKVAT